MVLDRDTQQTKFRESPIGRFFGRIRYMEQEAKKPNKAMFWIGIIIVATVVILLLTGGEGELRIWPIPFGIIGIVLIGTSRYRPLKKIL